MSDECNSRVVPYICGKNALYGQWECETCTPTRIDIVVPPTKLVYNYGELIDIHGIVVKAYCKDGTEWGEVPFDELSFEPTVASDEYEWSAENGETMYDAGHYLGWLYFLGHRNFTKAFDGKSVSFWNDNTNGNKEGPITIGTSLNDASVYANSTLVEPNKRYTFQGVEFFVNSSYHHGPTSYETPLPVYHFDFDFYEPLSDEMCLEIFTALGISVSGSSNQVTISWARPGDGQILTDAYEITVN